MPMHINEYWSLGLLIPALAMTRWYEWKYFFRRFLTNSELPDQNEARVIGFAVFISFLLDVLLGIALLAIGHYTSKPHQIIMY